MDLKIDADARNPLRRRFWLCHTIYLIYQGLWWQYPGYSACA